MVPEPYTGVALPYEQAAMAGADMPKGLSWPDQILFQSLRKLYGQYYDGKTTREKAVVEKKEFLREYDLNKFTAEMERTFVASIKATELARAAYRKDRTLENADRLLRAIEGTDVP